MRLTSKLALIISAAFVLAGCSPSMDQSAVCEVGDWHFDSVARVCKPGQKVAFLPPASTSEQIPVIFAAVNCDMRHTIVISKNAAACIYLPIKPKQPETAAPPAKK